MCRTTDQYYTRPEDPRDRLKITAFYLQLSLSTCSTTSINLPDSVTLLFLPRIDATLLEVNGSKIRPDSPAFLTLHRLIRSPTNDVVFATRERVKASNGLMFEVHVGDNKLIKGVFRGDDDNYDDNDGHVASSSSWKMECKCVLEKEVSGVDINEVLVVVESGRKCVMREKVAVVVAEKGRRRRCRRFETGLEEIPEERERDLETDEGDDKLVFDDDNCCCCRSSDENDDEEDEYYGVSVRKEDVEMEMDMMDEGMKWAVDVGIWVMCLGVGFLVSRASAKRLRRRRNFLK